MAICPQGPHREGHNADPDDGRAREVGRGHSSEEASEQSGTLRCGAGGAKGRGQGECAPAKHAPDSVPDQHVTSAGDRMRPPHGGGTFGPEVGAVCGKAARTVLCGGRSAMSVPTATVAAAPRLTMTLH